MNLWIYEFLFNSGDRIFKKKKKKWKFWELKIQNTIDIFNIFIVY